MLDFGVITGTENNDVYTFGNYSNVQIESLDMSEGTDTLKLGNYAVIEIDFISNVEKITVGTGTYVSSALYEALDDTAKAKAQLIGENDTFADAFALESKTTGFLNSSVDTVDYFVIGEFDSVSLSKNDAVSLTYYDASYQETTLENATFVGVSLNADYTGTYSYTLLAS